MCDVRCVKDVKVYRRSAQRRRAWCIVHGARTRIITTPVPAANRRAIAAIALPAVHRARGPEVRRAPRGHVCHGRRDGRRLVVHRHCRRSSTGRIVLEERGLCVWIGGVVWVLVCGPLYEEKEEDRLVDGG